MSIKMHSDLLEDVDRLADQFSRLTLSDEVKKLPTVTASNNGTPHIKMTLSNKIEFPPCLVISNNESINDKVTISDEIKKPPLEIVSTNGSIRGKEILPISVAGKEDETTQNGKFSEIKYYAVALPEEAEHHIDPSTLVYNELKNALVAIKSYKGSRFRGFSKKEDALQFASQPLKKIVEKQKGNEDGSTLRSATSQELCQLRKYIECGNEIDFVKTVWNNPKILVGRCDTPSIMQEGMRYNALHVAAKSNKPYICQLILDTIENPRFLKQIYSGETEYEREKIMYRLLDLYINTPDKKTGDTPLHYASKFGCIDCIKVLLAHPSCVPDRKNVAGLTAREIICNRLQPKSISLIENIEEVFKGLMYIPILRSNSDDMPPIVGKPCSCKDIAESTRGSTSKNPKPLLSLKAFIGPMSPEIAEQLYVVIKNPSSSQIFSYSPDELKLISRIRFIDREKGIERIGRWLAEDLNVQWMEYFPVLEVFTNLALKEGLMALEMCLNKCSQACCMPYLSHNPEVQSVFLVHHYPSHINPLAHYVNVHLNREKENEYDYYCDEIYCTPPTSPVKCPDDDYFVTPPASPSRYPYEPDDTAVFLQGSSLSKLDVHVLLAIGDIELDACEYPNVSKWKSLIERKLQIVTKTTSPYMNSLRLLTSIVLPRLQISERICTPKKTLLNNAFCFNSDT